MHQGGLTLVSVAASGRCLSLGGMHHKRPIRSEYQVFTITVQIYYPRPVFSVPVLHYASTILSQIPLYPST